MYALSETSRLRSLYDLVLMEAHLECNMQEASRPEWCLCLYFKQLAYCGIFYETVIPRSGENVTTRNYAFQLFVYLQAVCRNFTKIQRMNAAFAYKTVV